MTEPNEPQPEYSKWKGLRKAGEDALEVALAGAGVGALDALREESVLQPVFLAIGEVLGVGATGGAVIALAVPAAAKALARLANNWRKHRVKPQGGMALDEARRDFRNRGRRP